jgi:hypothetical protein
MRSMRVRNQERSERPGHGDAAAKQRPREEGWAEIVIIVLFAAVIGFAFLWALVLHEKPVDKPNATKAFDPTASTLVPPTLPAPKKYVVADSGVNIRQGPATNTAALTKLAAGAKVKVICKTTGQDVTGDSGSTNLWLRVDLGGFGVGYASALYVDTGDDIDDPNLIGDCSLAPPA